MYAYGFWAGIGILFIFLMTSLGSASAFLLPAQKNPLMQRLMMGFAAGVMSAAAVWSLLLPALEQAALDGRCPPFVPAALGLVLGAMFVGVLEIWQQDGGEGRLLFAAVTLHNIPEGLAVGLAFALAGDGENLFSALALAFGIGVQNFPEGAAVSLPLSQSGLSRSAAFMRGLASGAVEPLAAVLALCMAAVIHPVMPWLLSFSAGAMLYVSSRELIPNAQGACGSLAYIFGFVLMMVLDVALG